MRSDAVIAQLARARCTQLYHGVHVECGGGQILLRGVLVAFKGDWKFKHEALHLERWYNTNMVCHKCLAGKEAPFPYKELALPARWQQTVAVGSANAWPGTPPVTEIPGFEAGRWRLRSL